MADQPLKVILGSEALLTPLTGIGQYTLHLAAGLQAHPDIQLRYFANGRLRDFRSQVASLEVGDAQEISAQSPRTKPIISKNLRAALARSDLAVRCYEFLMPIMARVTLRPYTKSHVFHAPNFLLPAFKGIRIVTIHDLSTVLYSQCHPAARVRLVNRAIEKAVIHADHIITDSQFVRRQLIESFNVAEARSTAISLGANANYIPRTESDCVSVLQPLGLRFKAFFLFVSTIEPRKNLLNLLNAYEAYSSGCSAPLPLIIIGNAGWNSDAEHRRIKQLEAKGLVRYLGYVTPGQLATLYSAARALLFPSLYEGFGLPVLEAMQSGTAVLTSVNSAMSEVSQTSAYLVDPLDVDAITLGIERLAGDAALVGALQELGLQRASAFSWQRCVEETVEVYRSFN